jgi:hypothetical protein
MSRTLYLLHCIPGTWVWDGTHQTSVNHHWYLDILTNMAPRLVTWHKRNWCQVSVERRWHFIHVGICFKSLASQVFHMGSEEMEITEPHSATQGYEWKEFPEQLSYSQLSYPVLPPSVPEFQTASFGSRSILSVHCHMVKYTTVYLLNTLMFCLFMFYALISRGVHLG